MDDRSPDITSPHGLADDAVQQLDPRYVPLQRKVGWLTVAGLTPVAATGILLALLTGWASMLSWLLAGTAGAALALAAWFAHTWPPRAYRHASYRADADGLEIRRGVLWREVVNVPRSRVQHTDVSQGPLERSHGLATLVVHTAGAEHAQVELPGLPYEVALRLRDHLLPRDASDAV